MNSNDPKIRECPECEGDGTTWDIDDRHIECPKCEGEGVMPRDEL